MANDRFAKVEDQYFTLKGQLASGRISESQFDAALNELVLQDDQGRYWTIGGENGKWFVHDGNRWVSAQPQAAIPSGPPPSPPPFVQPGAASPAPPPILTQVYELARQILARLAGLSSFAPGAQASAGSIRESLLRLGISFTRKQITGFVLSILGGMVVARILPFVYPLFDPIITVVFGSGPGGARDGFNTNMMTLITFSTSFGLSFLTMVLTKVQKR